MGRTTGIEWTDATWNPIRGCSRVSEGCRNCYAERVAARFSGSGAAYEGLAVMKNGEPRWTGEIRFIEKHLRDPLRWKTPMRIFVNSMSDLFHPGVSDEMLGRIFDVMATAPQHVYQILTKRPERMREVLAQFASVATSIRRDQAFKQPGITEKECPPKNWHFGVSIEDQKTAEERLPILMRCETEMRIVSYEPAIGPVDFRKSLGVDGAVDWIICGGESGPGARPMHPEWARKTRDFCIASRIPFFFKQWGEWLPGLQDGAEKIVMNCGDKPIRIGKTKAGSLLDGREWKEYPE